MLILKKNFVSPLVFLSSLVLSPYIFADAYTDAAAKPPKLSCTLLTKKDYKTKDFDTTKIAINSCFSIKPDDPKSFQSGSTVCAVDIKDLIAGQESVGYIAVMTKLINKLYYKDSQTPLDDTALREAMGSFIAKNRVKVTVIDKNLIPSDYKPESSTFPFGLIVYDGHHHLNALYHLNQQTHQNLCALVTLHSLSENAKGSLKAHDNSREYKEAFWNTLKEDKAAFVQNVDEYEKSRGVISKLTDDPFRSLVDIPVKPYQQLRAAVFKYDTYSPKPWITTEPGALQPPVYFWQFSVGKALKDEMVTIQRNSIKNDPAYADMDNAEAYATTLAQADPITKKIYEANFNLCDKDGLNTSLIYDLVQNFGDGSFDAKYSGDLGALKTKLKSHQSFLACYLENLIPQDKITVSPDEYSVTVNPQWLSSQAGMFRGILGDAITRLIPPAAEATTPTGQ